MCRKAKQCWVLSTNFSVQLSRFKAKHDREELSSLAELAKKSNFFKIAVWGSDPMKQLQTDFN